MNKTNIEWTDYTWNPITGCKHGCWYCYAYKMFTRFHRSFEPTFHPERLSEPSRLGLRSKIFVCSVADLFAPWTDFLWRTKVLEAIEQCPVKHTFQLLTKNPECIYDYVFPRNVWVGATVTDYWEAERHIPELLKADAAIRFVSFEPLLSNMLGYHLDGLDWIIIGKLTGSKKIPLNPKWVQEIIDEARKHDIPVFVKNNVKWPEKIQQFPVMSCLTVQGEKE